MGFFSKLGEKIDKGISWIGQQLKKFATLAADFFRRVKDGIRKFAMIIGKFFSLLAKCLDTAISINSCPITIPDKMTVRF